MKAFILLELFLFGFCVHGGVPYVVNFNGAGTNTTLQMPFAFGGYQTTPQYNFIPAGDSNRFTGATYSGIISPEYSGSASALGDMVPSFNDAWDNKQKPYFIISTRGNGASIQAGCNIGTVTNLVNIYVTNNFVSFWTNNRVRIAMELEDGWVTNYRSANGLLCWNTNRFPLGTWIKGTSGINASNLTYYLRTNGMETFLMMYSTPIVPTNWLGNSFSTTFSDASGNTEWDGVTGGNPFGASEYNVSLNPESLHRDISSFYSYDVSGVFFQHTISGASPGFFNQLGRKLIGASLFPQLYTSDTVLNQPVDAYWHHGYGIPWYNFRNAFHPMLTATMMGSADMWNSQMGNLFNGLLVESNDAQAGPPDAGQSAIAYCMNQIKWQSYFITNNYGYCHSILAGDGMVPENWVYSDWFSYATVNAFFNCNPILFGTSSGAFPNYVQTSAGFASIMKNRNWISVNQDVTGKPPICVSMNTNNSIFYRMMSDGSRLVFMENSKGNSTTTNLTVTWENLGIASNTIVSPRDLITNSFLGLYTNSITWTVPSTNCFSFVIPPLLQVDNGNPTNSGQIFTDASGNILMTSTNNRRAIRIFANGGTVFIGTNDLPSGNLNAGLSVQAPGVNGEVALTLYSAAGNQYDFTRDAGTGLMRLIGAQANQFSGLSLGSSGGDAEFARFGGIGIMLPTNAVANVPATPLTPGGCYIWNSNGTVYIKTSLPASSVWNATTKIAP